MYQQTYFAKKQSGTSADVLAAYGLAAVLDALLARALGPTTPRAIRLWDDGPYYRVELSRAVQAEWLEQVRPFTVIPFVATDKAKPEDEPQVRDYDAEWEQFKQYRRASEVARAAARTGDGSATELAQVAQDLKPLPDFWVVTLIGDYRMQAQGIHNAAATQWWATRQYFPANLRAILALSASPDADLEQVTRVWAQETKGGNLKAEFTASQLLNPHQGKGQNRAKANQLSMGNLSSFWLLEYLKIAGLWRCAAPRTVRDGDDRKTYVLAPLNLTLATHNKVFERFAERLWGETAVKMDIIAALLYTETLLEYSEAGRTDELDFEGYGPENVVAGLHVSQYKLLSRNSYTMINLGFIGLPHWTGRARQRVDVRALQDILREHHEIVRDIEEERSDGYNLLTRYRDFLSASQLSAFFDFTHGYSQYLMSELAHGKRYARAFTTPNLRRLIATMDERYAEIVENPGFQEIAYAIRYSTIIPQGRKARGEDNLYDIRYGLGADLKRRAPFKKDFLAALGDFIQTYNQETEQVLESKGHQMRRGVRTEAIVEIVRLADHFGSDVVCNLLVAFGYAREPKEEPTT